MDVRLGGDRTVWDILSFNEVGGFGGQWKYCV
jgi:hypothetical protein